MATRISLGSLKQSTTSISNSPRSAKTQSFSPVKLSTSPVKLSSPTKQSPTKLSQQTSPQKQAAKGKPVSVSRNYVYEANLEGSSIQNLFLNQNEQGVIIKRSLKNWTSQIPITPISKAKSATKSPKSKTTSPTKQAAGESTKEIYQYLWTGSQTSAPKQGESNNEIYQYLWGQSVPSKTIGAKKTVNSAPTPAPKYWGSQQKSVTKTPSPKKQQPQKQSNDYESTFDGSIIQNLLQQGGNEGVVIRRSFTTASPKKQQQTSPTKKLQQASPSKKLTSPPPSPKRSALSPAECANRNRGESFSEDNFNGTIIQRKLSQ